MTNRSSAAVTNRKVDSLVGWSRRSFASTLASLLCGCGYTIGRGFDKNIRSVHVPIFKSTVQRRGLEFQLTEAVQKQIQTRSHFLLADDESADTRLMGTVTDFRKEVLGETRFDDPRELQIGMTVKIRWEDLRHGELLAARDFDLDQNEVQFVTQAEFAPEVGQSLASASQQTAERISRDIVDMMEAPW